MSAVSTFINRKGVELLAYLDGNAPNAVYPNEPMDFVDNLLEDWRTLTSHRQLSPPSRAERTFWYALYLFEDSLDFTGDDPTGFETLQIQNLSLIRELLRQGKSLPEQFFATRPGEFDDEEFDDAEFEAEMMELMEQIPGMETLPDSH